MIADIVQTPVSNTGLKCQDSDLSVKIDFLQFVFPVVEQSDFVSLIDFLMSIYKDEAVFAWDTPAVHGQRYQHSGRSVRGCCFALNLPEESKPGSGWLSIPGSVLGQVAQTEIWASIQSLLAWQARCTRIDVCIDDYSKSIAASQVMSAVDAGNFAGCRDVDPRFPRTRGKSPEVLGWTIYFGSTQSDKRVRYYNKSVESKGDIDSYRWEVQFRDKKAAAVVDELMQIEATEQDEMDQLLAMYLSAYVTGAISFVDRSSGDRLSRQNLLDWWQEFVNRVGGSIKISLPSPRRTLDRSLQWLHRQVATTLAVVADVFGVDRFREFLSTTVSDGRDRYSSFHRSLVRVAAVEGG